VFPELLSGKLRGVADLSEAQLGLLEGHFKLLQHWNQTLNLISRVSVDKIIERHYAESVFVAVHLPPGALTIVDIGSGGGFPGVPIAIMRPECSVTLVEAHQRKSVFLREATRGIDRLRVFPKRLSDLGESFEWAASRAVRFEDIELDTARVASSAALLAGEEQPSGNCFTWNNPIRLPWGDRRFLWIGKRST
jgi:16S rRNA (guanine527-N7)-methyltransferase